MTKVDQFESVFRAAAKETYSFDRKRVQRPLFVSDEDSDEASAVEGAARVFLGAGGLVDDGAAWSRLGPGDYDSVEDLLGHVQSTGPDLVCTWRNLKSNAWRWPYSLGAHVDVLTQIAPCPVLLVPHPEAGRAADRSLKNAAKVMAITDHLAGDAPLVDWAASATAPDGSLVLAHVEDGRTFDRYIDVISKLPAIDTDLAREAILDQLLKEPRDYFEACAKGLSESGVRIRLESVVESGHHLTEYKKLVDDRSVDLLVLETKDEDQLAMHGLAYALSVELREIPLLLI